MGNNSSARRVWTETPFSVIALRANTITSLIAALRSKRSFRGGAFLMCSRIRSMMSPARSASPTTQPSASLTSPRSDGWWSRKFSAARAFLRALALRHIAAGATIATEFSVGVEDRLAADLHVHWQAVAAHGAIDEVAYRFTCIESFPNKPPLLR